MDQVISYDYYGNPIATVDPATVTRLADIKPFDRKLPGEGAPLATSLKGAYEEFDD